MDHPDLDMNGNPIDHPDLDMEGNPIQGSNKNIPLQLDLFAGQNYLPYSMPLKRPEISGVPPRGLSIGPAPTPIQFPVGFHGPQEHISAYTPPKVTPHYGYGPEWDNLGIGAGIPPTGNEVPSPYGINFTNKLKEFHEAPPIIPSIGKFLGNVVDPYLPGYGQTTGAKLAGIGARGIGDLASGLTTPENLLIAAAFNGAELAANGARGAREALNSAPLIRPLLKSGEKVGLLELPQLERVARNYVEGQAIREANKALQTGAGLYFGGQSANQAINANTPEERVAGILGTALGGLGAYHGAREVLRSEAVPGESAPEESAPFDPATATREEIIQEALKRSGQVQLSPEGRIILPEGWTAEIGQVPGDKIAMSDKNTKKLIFNSSENLANNSVYNHEAVHAILASLPDKTRSELVDAYINNKVPTWEKEDHSKNYMVVNGFYKEDMAIDLGNYFTYPEMVEPGVKKVFDSYLGGKKETGVKTEVNVKTPVVETSPVVESPVVETQPIVESKPATEVNPRIAILQKLNETTRSRLADPNLSESKRATLNIVTNRIDAELDKLSEPVHPDLTMEGKPVTEPTVTEPPEFHHGIIPPQKDTVTIRGKDAISIDKLIQAKEKEGYEITDIDDKGGIVMTRASKARPSETRPSKTSPVRGPKIEEFEPEVRRALEEATAGLQNLVDRNRVARAERFARARGVKATGLGGAREVLRAMGGKYGDVTMEPLGLTSEQADKIANKIWVNTYDDMPAQLHAYTALNKLLDGVVPPRSELEAFSRATGIETSDLFAEYFHGFEGKEEFPDVDIKRPSWTSELVNLPKTLQASMDLSAPFRQGIGLIHTKSWWKSWGTMVRSMGSETFYRSAIDEIHSRPEFQTFRGATGKVQKSLANRAGLRLTDLTDITKREESMMSSWAESGQFFNKETPGLTTAYKNTIGRSVRASNRAYIAFLDKLRADTFRDLIREAAKSGLDPTHDDILLKKIGDYVNNATGRGTLPEALEDSAVALNSVLFSPRLIASRLQMLNPRNYIFQPAFIRQQYLKSTLAIATAWMTFAGLAKLGGAQVSNDPNSADFMKIRIGNTRLDLGGGFQQYLVLAHRLYSGKFVSSTSGKGYEFGQKYGKKTRMDAIVDFVHNKMAPIPGNAWSALDATKYQPFQVGDTAAGMFTPMVIQDLISIAKDDPNLLWMVPLSGIGGGTQTYGEGGLNYTFIPPKHDIIIPSNAKIR